MGSDAGDRAVGLHACDQHGGWRQPVSEDSHVGKPGYEERYREWSMYAFDPSEKPVVGKRSREWTAVGQTKLHCVQVMARCLGDLKVGRWPK